MAIRIQCILNAKITDLGTPQGRNKWEQLLFFLQSPVLPLGFLWNSLDLLKMTSWIRWFPKALLIVPSSPSPVPRCPLLLIFLGPWDFLDSELLVLKPEQCWADWGLAGQPKHHHHHHHHHSYHHHHCHHRHPHHHRHHHPHIHSRL